LTVVGKAGASITAPSEDSTQIDIRTATVTLRDLRFDGATAANESRYGVVSSQGTFVQIDRCRFTGFERIAIAALGGYKITNSIIDNSGRSGSSPPIQLNSMDAKEQRIFAYNTVTSNRWVVGCGPNALAPVETGNLITDGVAPAIDLLYGCPSTFSNSRLGPYPGFDQRPGREYRITASSPCVNWSQDPSPPRTDIDGDPRPAGQSDCGADEFIP
jgi:hypothetical protein